jgi:hypothetical protein
MADIDDAAQAEKQHSTLSHIFERLNGSAREEALVRYTIGQIHRGRSLASIFEDPYLTNRLEPAEARRLLDHREIVDAAGGDAVAALRAQISSLGPG